MLSAQDEKTLRRALCRFDNWSPTTLTTHCTDATCCTAAQLWFHAMDSEHRDHLPESSSELSMETEQRQTAQPPIWMQQYFQWGAAPLHLTWCEALQRETLDCGVLAALAYASFAQQTAQVYRVQAVMTYAPTMIEQWCQRWQSHECSTQWIQAPFVYHEMVGIVEPDAANGQLRLYDPSECVWVDGGLSTMEGGIVALRVVGTEHGRTLRWDSTSVTVNQWHSLLA